jgi:hypothetical protein
MSRQILTKREVQASPALRSEGPAARAAAPAGPLQVPDGYSDKLMKYLPGEAVAVYTTVRAISLPASGSADADTMRLLSVATLAMLIGTPVYLWRACGVRSGVQLGISTLAFAVWVFTLGGSLFGLSLEPRAAAVLLVLFTFFAPLLDPPAKT